jgi:predicted small integral membrane protein
MQALLNTYKESRKTYRTAILRYQQDRSDSQFHQLMGEAELALGNAFLAYADAWWDSPIGMRAEFPNPHSVE